MTRKLNGTYIQFGSITTTQLSSAVTNQIAAGGGPKVTAITYPNSATAAANTGNESIVLTGTGFESGIQIYINGNAVPSVTRTNANSVSFTTAALSSTTHPFYVVNPDGGTAIVVPGLQVSGKPIWTTSSPLSSWSTAAALSQTFVANSDSSVTYSLESGSSLPGGLSLAANGLLSGTLTSPPANTTTYNFTVVAADAENQKTSKAFSIDAIAGVAASGGTVSNIAGYRVHTFTSSGSFEVIGSGEVEYLVVAGGGGGSRGGGGAGGFLTGTGLAVTAGVTYTITVGAGSSGASSSGSRGSRGSNTTISGTGFTTITAVGGGAGGAYADATNSAGGDGGSGGGGADFGFDRPGGKGVYPGSSFISSARQGYDGAMGYNGGGYSGGGGAGAAGNNGGGNPVAGGSGGAGAASSISGSSVTYAGGGGGGSPAGVAGAGGTGGGGAGGAGPAGTATAGTTNTGGGGGGVRVNTVSGAAGGSGIVIIRYAV